MQELNFIRLRAVALAWRDSAFKAMLLVEPHEALKSFMRVELPHDVELRVREGAKGEQGACVAESKLLDIVLPPAPRQETLQPVALGNYAEVALSPANCKGPSCACCC